MAVVATEPGREVVCPPCPCDRCGQTMRLHWHVDGFYWWCIAGREWAHRILCFSCGNELAHGMDMGHVDYLAMFTERGMREFINRERSAVDWRGFSGPVVQG